MRIGFGLSIATPRYRPGVGSPPQVPVLSGLAYNSVANLLSVSSTMPTAGTIYYILHTSATPLGAAAIRDAVEYETAIAFGTIEPPFAPASVNWSFLPSGTYWVQAVQAVQGGTIYSNVLVLEVELEGAQPEPPPPLPAPVLSGTLAFSVNNITRNATTSYNVDIPAQHYWRIYPGSATPSVEDIRAGVGAIAAGDNPAGAGSIEVDWELPPNIYELGATVHVVARVLPDGPWSNILTATGVDVDTRPGIDFIETFGDFNVGDSSTQILAAGWSRTSANTHADIEADADGPAGKRFKSRTANTEHHTFYRNDIAAALALGNFSSVEVLFRVRAHSIAGTRGGFGMRVAAGSAHGVAVNRYSSGTSISIGVNFSMNGDGPVALIGGQPTGTLIWCRILFDNGTRLRGKAWTGALSDEPANWSAPVTLDSGTWASVLRNIGPMTRSNGGNSSNEVVRFLGFSVGIDRPAPNFYP